MQLNEALLTVLLSTGLILLLVAAVVIVIISASKQKVKQQMDLATLRLNYEKELRTVANEMQEQTMTAISRELHDNIGQLLTLMKIQIEQAKLDHGTAAALLAPVDQSLDQAHRELRLLSRQLGAEQLQQRGLFLAIEQEVQRLSALSVFRISLEADGAEPDLDADQQLMAYRIFQELLQNIVRHAQATQVIVVLRGKGRFSLQVADNGTGFIYEAQLKAAGAGLKNMSKRAKMARFEYLVCTRPGSGTQVCISASDEAPAA